jgi:hypothetical protein
MTPKTPPLDVIPVARLTYVMSRRVWNLPYSVGGDRFRKYAPRPSGSLVNYSPGSMRITLLHLRG